MNQFKLRSDLGGRMIRGGRAEEGGGEIQHFHDSVLLNSFDVPNLKQTKPLILSSYQSDPGLDT